MHVHVIRTNLHIDRLSYGVLVVLIFFAITCIIVIFVSLHGLSLCCMHINHKINKEMV